MEGFKKTDGFALLLCILGVAVAVAVVAFEKLVHLTPETWFLVLSTCIVIILLCAVNAALLFLNRRTRFGAFRMSGVLLVNLGIACLAFGLAILLAGPSSHDASKRPAEDLPGFFAVSFIRMYDTPELRRKYIFQFGAPTGAKTAFYISPNGLFTFSATDVHGEVYALEIPLSTGAIPINRYTFLYCDLGLGSHSTFLRVFADGNEVASRTLSFPIDLGKNYHEWRQVTVGADNTGKNNAPFKIAMFGHGHTTLTHEQINQFKGRFDEFLTNIDSPIRREP
jgi:hypothetical protein